MLKIIKNLLKPIVLRRCRKEHLKKYDSHGNVVREIFFSFCGDEKDINLFTYDDQNRMLTWVSSINGKIDMVITHDYTANIGEQKNYEYESGKRVLKRHSIGYYDKDGTLIKSIVNGVEQAVPSHTVVGNTEIEKYTEQDGTERTWQTLKDKKGRDLFSHCHSVEIDGTVDDTYVLTTYRDDGQLWSRIRYQEFPNSSKASYFRRTSCQYDIHGRIESSIEETSYGYYKSRHYYSEDGTEDFYVADSSLTGYYGTLTKKKDNVEIQYFIPPKWAFIFK